jgi:glycosyltransferase involved in cell wall biosynthesis
VAIKLNSISSVGGKQVDKVDLVMWTKNGAETLPSVLKRIKDVIPTEFVNKKVIADDQSTDETRKIAESCGWVVVPNQGKGISDNANTALKMVSSEFFVSFEQDLLLSQDWWTKVPLHLTNPRIAVASGMRFASKPIGVRKLQKYVAKQYRGKAELGSWLKSRKMAAFTLGKTLDNTIYRTSVLKAVGGFPKLPSSSGVDTALAYILGQRGYFWFVDYAVQSVHLRRGLRQELSHQYWYAKQLKEMWRRIKAETNMMPPVTRSGVVFRFVVSPFTGLLMAWKMREPSIVGVHPLIRLYYLRGFLESR